MLERVVVIALLALPNCVSAQVRDNAALGQVCGTWKIDRVIETKNVQARPMAELLGQSIVYSGTEMKIGSRLVTHAPVYAETVKTERTFFVEYNVRRSELGIKTETILMVTVSASPRQRIYEPGEFVIIKGIDSLIIPWQGVFYELRRLRSCGKEGGKDLN